MKKQLQNAFGALVCANCLETIPIQSFEIFDPAAEDNARRFVLKISIKLDYMLAIKFLFEASKVVPKSIIPTYFCAEKNHGCRLKIIIKKILRLF